MTTDTLAFLDACGRDPTLLDDFATRVAALDLPETEAGALLARDPVQLAQLLGAKQGMMCHVFPADDEPQKQDDQPTPDDAPGDDNPEQR